MKNLLFLFMTTIILTACDFRLEKDVYDYNIKSITEDFCYDGECIYTVKGSNGFNSRSYKVNSDMYKNLKPGQKIRFRHNENRFIIELLTE